MLPESSRSRPSRLVPVRCSVRVVRSGRLGSPVRVVRYGRAFRAVKEVVVESCRSPGEIALHSLRIGGAAALAVGRDISERVIKREARWRSDTYKTYTQNSIEGARRFWNKPGVASGVMERLPGKEQYGVAKYN